MKIHQLQRSKGLKDKQRRLGRWNATGSGNYSGKWLKGQKSRSWFSMKPFFEGWQTSIVQRLPKARGFTRYYKLVKDVSIINLGVLDADVRITDAMEITKQLLKDLWYIKSATAHVKILWHGDYAKHLTFKDIDTFSASAKAKMEKPGTVHSVPKKTPTKAVKDSKSKAWKLKSKTSPIKNAKPVVKKVEAPVIKKEVKKIEAPKLIPTTADKPTPVAKPVAKVAAKPVVKKEVAKPAAKVAAKKPVAKKAK